MNKKVLIIDDDLEIIDLRKILELHHSDIQQVSQLNRGTTFSF